MTEKAKSIEVAKSEEKETPEVLAPRESVSPFLGLRDEIDRVFDRFFHEDWPMTGPRLGRLWDWFPSRAMRAPFGGMAMLPRTDMTESATGFELSVELPGLDDKDIEVTVAEDVLTIQGEKKQEKETEGKDYHLTERSYGSFRRQFTLPRNVDTSKLQASFAKGVLTVTLPKTKEAQTKVRKIDVKAA